jgi:DNA polymerase V
MSSRVMQTLSRFTPQIEVYSIDEAFLDLSGLADDLTTYGRQIRRTVQQWTGLPVSVGIARTKTLAKVANKLAKTSGKAEGVLDLTDPRWHEAALKRIEVEDVWGIGRRCGRRLRRIGITDAWGLRNADLTWIQKTFGVNGLRTVYELQGTPCYALDEHPPAKKGITVSRSFGYKIETLEDLREAAATYAVRAGEKLRGEKRAAGVLTVFVMTSRFDKNKHYYNTRTLEFDRPTADTTQLVQATLDGIEKIYRKGFRFQKCGVILHRLVDENRIQGCLFDTTDHARSRRLMHAVDRINRRTYAGIHWAAQGLSQRWKTQFLHRSRRYTTHWNELLTLK